MKPFDLKGKRVFVAGASGMVGRAIIRRLASESCEIISLSRGELDLRQQADVEAMMQQQKPDAVILAAAKVGGIAANDAYPVDFLLENLQIETNVLHSAHNAGVEKLLFVGSSCVYPKNAPQPMSEDALLTGPLEETSEWYAVAKLAGIKLCQAYRKQHGRNYITAMPASLYGPHDNFDAQTAHFIPAMIQKTHKACLAGDDVVEIWGTGTPRRECMYVDDCADALIYLLQHYSGTSPINVGTGTDDSIQDIAAMIMDIAGFEGALVKDETKPDGTPRKLMNIDKLTALGWGPKTDLRIGLASTYQWFCQQYGE